MDGSLPEPCPLSTTAQRVVVSAFVASEGRSAGAPIRARHASASMEKGVWCSGYVSQHISGCHCTATTKAPSSASRASTMPSSLRATTFRPSPTRSTAWWWKLLTWRSVVPKASAKREPDVLVQAAPVGDVDELDAATDAQDGLAKRSEGAVERQLEGITTAVHHAEIAVGPRSEEVGVDVDATREQEPVGALRVGLGQRGVDVGRHHRHGPGRRQGGRVVVTLDDVVAAQAALTRHRAARHQDDRS